MLVKFTDIHITQSQVFLSSHKYVKKNEMVPITSYGDINFEAIFQTNENIETRMLHWVGKEVIKGHHILFAKPHEKRSNFNVLQKSYNNDIIPVQDLIRVSPQFLYYYLYLKRNQIIITTKKGQRVSKEKLGKLTVQIPKLADQKNIISSLKQQVENAETLTKNIQKEINNLKKASTQIFLKAFRAINRFKTQGKVHFSDTKIIRIGDAGIIQAGKTPNGSIRNYFGNEFPFYNQTAFDQGMNVHTANKHLSARGMREARLFNENSILVCFIGAHFGKAGIARHSGACNSQILSISAFENLLPEYLYYQIISDSFQSQMKQFSTNHCISKADFEHLYIEVPPIKKQEETISFLKDHLAYFDKKISDLSNKLNKTDLKQLEIFSSLLVEKNIHISNNSQAL